MIERRFVIDGKYVLPCMVLSEGRFRTRVAIFKPFDGTKVKRVRDRDLLSLEDGREWLAWRKDPMQDVPPENMKPNNNRRSIACSEIQSK